jgi:hypothetical protein
MDQILQDFIYKIIKRIIKNTAFFVRETSDEVEILWVMFFVEGV